MTAPVDAAAHAAELHSRAIVIDCHSDILMPIADGHIRMADDVQVPDPRREVLGEHAEPPSHLEHDVGRRQLGGLADQPQHVVVDEEVLAQLAVGPHVEAAQPVDAALAGAFALPPGRPAHQPRTRAAVASTTRSSSP